MPYVETTSLGGLRCRVVGGGENPKLAAILCHGFGAPGNDIVPVAGELIASSPIIREHVRFVFPEGPLSMDEEGLPGGRAWWPVDMMRLQQAWDKGEIRILRDERPEMLMTSRCMLHELVDELRQETGLATSRLVLGGFSQGAMLTTDLALHLEESPAALIVWSGTLINEAEWRQLAPDRAGLQVLQSHGRQDMVLPFAAAEWLRDLLSEAGLSVEFHAFDGPHTIPYLALQRTGELLEELVSSE